MTQTIVSDEMLSTATDAFYKNMKHLPEALRAVIEAALGAMWRPIAEAPRDGTPVWLYVKGQQTEAWYSPATYREVYEGVCDCIGGCWVCADDQWQIEVEEVHGEDGTIEYHDGAATHFAPLICPDVKEDML